MSQIGHNGGPAFPHTATPNSNPHPGMSLRDYFAGQALAAMMQRICENANSVGELTARPQILSEWAYRYADAMIAARGEQ